jgi:arginine/serine-rich splicing factor 4/5/6
MPSSVRIYLGRMPYRATERDIEDFFRGYGKISDIIIKTGFAFVEFHDARDADDAAHDLNGRMMMGERTVSVEVARGTPRGRDSFGDGRSGGGGGGRDSDRGSKRTDRRPERSDYRLIVTNLSTRIGWQELKDLFRDCGDVCYADAHTRKRNEGLVEFTHEKDMKSAQEKMDGKEFNGKKIELKEDDYTKKRRRSKSKSRSRSPRKSRSPRRSRSAASSRSRSPQVKRSKRKSSASRSPSPGEKKEKVEPTEEKENGKEEPDRKSKSKSRTPEERKSRSASSNSD